ncbi:MAG TPA: hypothetical protein VGO96_16310 [Pyrinomonadaceae bacterium]|jgi:hypothetical protein|nr:hypothetical protein [Pyrinomonadaceae bacterium]
MRSHQKFVRRLLFIISFVCAFQVANALAAQSFGALTFDEEPMLQPSDLFKDFPEIKWGMSFQDVKRAIEKTGARPVRATKDDETQLVWTGTFNGMEGRARVYFKEGAGAIDVVVGVYAYDKQKDVFEAWLKKLVEKHGAAKETSDNSISLSHVWRLKNGFVIELRSLKDTDSPVVDIHWVKE